MGGSAQPAPLTGLRRHAFNLSLYAVGAAGLGAGLYALLLPELPAVTAGPAPAVTVTATAIPGASPSQTPSAAAPTPPGTVGASAGSLPHIQLAGASSPILGLPSSPVSPGPTVASTAPTAPSTVPSSPAGTPSPSASRTAAQQGLTVALGLTPTPVVSVGVGLGGLDLGVGLGGLDLGVGLRLP